MEAGEILGTAAQIAVALAGFAGVVVVVVGIILLELYSAALLGYAKFFSRSLMRRSGFDTRPHPMNILPQSMKRLFH